MNSHSKRLDEDRCRFHCRTNKEAFMAGFEAGSLDAVEGGEFLCQDYKKEVMDKSYRKWMKSAG